jgi:flagellar protein FlaI
MAIDDAESSGGDDPDGAALAADAFVDPDLAERLAVAASVAQEVHTAVRREQGDTTPVVKDLWTVADYRREVGGDPSDALGFDADRIASVVARAGGVAAAVDDTVEERTTDVSEDLDEDAFFTTEYGTTTLANRYDLEKTVPFEKKHHFQEVDRYWVNKPYAFVVIFHSRKENEHKYYVVQPHTNEIEEDLVEFLTAKLQNAIKYADVGVAGGIDEREQVITDETYSLLERYDLYSRSSGTGLLDTIATQLDVEDEGGVAGRLLSGLGWRPARDETEELDGIAARPESVVVEEDPDTLTEYQVEKLLYYLKRDFIGYERIDAIKHDINVEDISCDGYNSPVFVYHSDHEQVISNIYHGETELDDFVVKLAQRSGKGISKRQPQVDATLPDGSRAQLTLGKEVSDHGTNYTIRQFKDVPFTPVDLINWKTFSLEEMAYLWLAIENNKSLIFAGGTASGKTTSLNAVSLFIPSNSKIVSIEDTREVELPQRNWVASVTRPSFADDDGGEVDEFDLLEAALRQRPEYIVMGEIRGEEGRTLFQVMSTGHTTLTTFHADSVGEVLKRFTTDPINVSKTMFTALNLVSIQTQTRVKGTKVRRNKNITEINFYDAENDEINVQDVYQWQAEGDEFLRMSESNTLEEIRFDRGWTPRTLDEEMFKRRVVLAYLIDRGLNTYTQVAATVQAFINDEETILGLMANDELERSLEDLREMESVLIDIDPEKEAMVPRPDPSEEMLGVCADILEEAEERLFDAYRETDVGDVGSVLEMETAADVTPSPSGDDSSRDRTGAGAGDDTPSAPATESSDGTTVDDEFDDLGISFGSDADDDGTAAGGADADVDTADTADLAAETDDAGAGGVDDTLRDATDEHATDATADDTADDAFDDEWTFGERGDDTTTEE